MHTKSKQDNLVFFSVVYPGAEIYLNDFLESLDRQTDKSFDLMLANDGLKNLSVYKEKFRNLNIIEVAACGTPAAIRSQGIRWIMQHGYDAIIFGDSDDYFDRRRIEINRHYLSVNAIVFNDLHLVNESGEIISEYYLSRRFRNGQIISGHELVDKNFIGLGNSSVHVSLLQDLNFPKDLQIFDWFLFSVLHSREYSSCFTNETTTCYRQHARNAVGIKEFEGPMILQSLKIKRDHYKHLVSSGLPYQDLFNQFDALYQKLERNPSLESEYIDYIRNRQVQDPLWWEQICLMENAHECAINKPC